MVTVRKVYYRVLVSTGAVAQPAAIRGAFDPARTNFFCGSCHSFVQAPPGATATLGKLFR